MEKLYSQQIYNDAVEYEKLAWEIRRYSTMLSGFRLNNLVQSSEPRLPILFALVNAIDFYEDRIVALSGNIVTEDGHPTVSATIVYSTKADPAASVLVPSPTTVTDTAGFGALTVLQRATPEQLDRLEQEILALEMNPAFAEKPPSTIDTLIYDVRAVLGALELLRDERITHTQLSRWIVSQCSEKLGSRLEARMFSGGLIGLYTTLADWTPIPKIVPQPEETVESDGNADDENDDDVVDGDDFFGDLTGLSQDSWDLLNECEIIPTKCGDHMVYRIDGTSAPHVLQTICTLLIETSAGIKAKSLLQTFFALCVLDILIISAAVKNLILKSSLPRKLSYITHRWVEDDENSEATRGSQISVNEFLYGWLRTITAWIRACRTLDHKGTLDLLATAAPRVMRVTEDPRSSPPDAVEAFYDSLKTEILARVAQVPGDHANANINAEAWLCKRFYPQRPGGTWSKTKPPPMNPDRSARVHCEAALMALAFAVKNDNTRFATLKDCKDLLMLDDTLSVAVTKKCCWLCHRLGGMLFGENIKLPATDAVILPWDPPPSLFGIPSRVLKPLRDELREKIITEAVSRTFGNDTSRQSSPSRSDGEAKASKPGLASKAARRAAVEAWLSPKQKDLVGDRIFSRFE